MFGGGNSTEYEDIVNKTTDENLTGENWELIMNLCDKVQDDGQSGAHSVIAAVLKRLAHRNPNVQLYALSLTESLSKNIGIEIHRELASRAFTQGLEKLITDRNTHDKVRRRALSMIAMWAADFESETTLGIMEDCYNNLKAKNYKFEQPQEPPPPTVDDEIRRKEEEELQRVLEMSMQDRGGNSQWAQYSLTSGSGAGSSSGGAGASNSSTSGAGRSSTVGRSSSPPSQGYTQPKYSGGYMPARTPSPATVAAQQRHQQQLYQESLAKSQAQQQQHSTSAANTPTVNTVTPTAAPAATTSSSASTTSMPAAGTIVTRVRALHSFQPTEPGELAFEQGDIIKVVDRGYKDWWRGQLKGRTGIFPVNYVEPMPEPTASELAKEAEQEAAVFAQAVNVEKLLNMLRALDPVKDNLADNEEIQEMYRSSMALRPRIVKLIDKYSQKRADLVLMNETFVRARSIFDRMMEESLARHTGVYDQVPYRQPQYPPPQPQMRPGSGAGRRPDYGHGPGPMGPPQPYGWNQGPAGYEQQPQPPPQAGPYPGYPGPYPVGTSPQAAPEAMYAPSSPGAAQQATPAGYAAVPGQGPQQQQQSVPAGYGVLSQGGYAGHQPGMPYTQQGPTPYPAQQQQQQQQQPLQPQHAQPVQQQQPLQVQQPLQQPLQSQPIQQQPAQQPPLQHQQSFQSQIQLQPLQPQPVQQQPLQQAQPQQQQYEQQQPLQAHQPEAVQNQAAPGPAGGVFSPQPQHQGQQQPLQQQPQVQAQVQPQQQQQEAQPQPQLAQLQAHAQPQQQQHEAQTHPQLAQPQAHVQPQSQAQSQPQQPISGPPPHPYDPSYTYADPNVQAWAQYYAQGGKELAGSVYFVSIPGVTDGAPASAPPEAATAGGSQQLQQQQQNGISPQRQQSLEQGSLSRQTSYQAQQQQQQGLGQPLGRTESYQAQPLPQMQAQPTEIEPRYGSPSNAGSPGVGGQPQPHQQPQQLQNVPRYQLQDGPSPSSHPQPQPQAGPGPAQYATHPQAQGSSPTRLSFGGAGPAGVSRPGAGPGYGPSPVGGSGTSPTPAASVPSWVLPKKTTATGA